ncbi:hypothetical protein [Pseudomonas paralcaligenes]|uniref:hypothetical protein n=1 Tax=Pseudomonas paralcaligenes TaxID=2772558 RepID=UPI001C826935|nr:hypothetical protein [Pseudomonas paralcaligenes]
MIKYLIDEDGLYLGNAIYPEPGQRWVATGWDGPVYDPAYLGGQVDADTGEVSGGAWVSTGAPPALAEIEAERLTAVLNGHLDAVAGERRYDNRFTCALRAGFEGPFQAEGEVFAAWMDACNLTAYQVMAECRAGLRQIPSDAELIAELPVINWPPSPIPEGAV